MVISDFHIIKKLRVIPELAKQIKVIYIASTVDERELLIRYKQRQSIDLNSDTKEALQTIEKMCSILSSAARLKYLRKIEDTLPLLNDQWNNYIPYFNTIKTRSLNIRMLYNRYIDNITEIDYALLNFYDSDYIFKQTRNIFKNAIPNKTKKILRCL